MSEELNNTEKTVTEETSPSQENLPHHLQVEEYGEGHIQARHGRINGWLMVVYAIMFIWAITITYAAFIILTNTIIYFITELIIIIIC